MEKLKEALTYEQQIERLKTVHNISVPSEEEALAILKSINYYRLSAYGMGLKKNDGTEEYIDGTSLEKLYKLYLFDSKFKNELIHIIEQIEIKLRTQISNHLALKYGSEGYINPDNFLKKANKEGADIHSNVIKNFREEIERQKNAPLVKHHMDKYGGHFPIWVAIELFTFGNLSSLYSIMKAEDKNAVAALYGTESNYLHSWILSLLEVRNICAHYSRLYNMPLKQSPYLYKENRKYRTKINKVFPVILVIKRMLCGSNLWNEFFSEIKQTFTQYSSVINLSFIGFPQDWISVLSK